MTAHKTHRLIEAFFPPPVVAGYTLPIVHGSPPEDLPALLPSLVPGIGIGWMHQIHTDIVRVIDAPGRYEGDGIFTHAAGLCLAVRTADCMPLIFFSKKENAIGVVHMGWRSAAAGILDRIPFDLASFSAVIGVGMRRCCYAVGEEFRAYPAFVPHLTMAAGALRFDPVGFAHAALTRRGMAPGRILDLAVCSVCSPEGFFSHRRTGTKSRTLSFICHTGNDIL